jgi:threonine dehydrogenase-like Zn-dependent dehydrogenase
MQWHGKQDVRVEDHEIPDITDPEDALVRVTCATVCGSDLHLYNGEVCG